MCGGGREERVDEMPERDPKAAQRKPGSRAAPTTSAVAFNYLIIWISIHKHHGGHRMLASATGINRAPTQSP
jgi:hypothetical protein